MTNAMALIKAVQIDAPPSFVHADLQSELIISAEAMAQDAIIPDTQFDHPIFLNTLHVENSRSP